MADVSSIRVPNIDTPYQVKDNGAVHKSGLNVTGNDFVLDAHNNGSSITIKTADGDLTGVKNEWDSSDGYNLPKVVPDIPSIASMIDAKIKSKVTAIEFTSTTTSNGRGWFLLPTAAQQADFCWIHLTSPTPNLDNYTFKSVPGDTWYGMVRNWDGSPLAANTPIAGVVYCVNF